MNIVYRVTQAGVDFGQHPTERRSILLTNIISLVLFVLGLILFIVYYFWFGWSMITLAIPCISLLCLSSVILNRFGLSVVSRFVISLLIPATTISLSVYSKTIYYHSQEELDYFTFRFIILSSCVFPAILFSIRQWRLLLSCSLISLFILMLHDPVHDWFNVPYRTSVHGELKTSNYTFTNIIVFTSYLILCAGVLFLKWVSENNEQRADQLIGELNLTNEELKEKNEEIKAQHTTILAQAEKLQLANNLIEEQKNQLQIQNERLANELMSKNAELTETNAELIKYNNELRQFSYTVSHNLRGPVASLLGLMDLLDLQKFAKEDAEVLQHVKVSTINLDVIIKDLAKIIDIRNDIFQIRQKIDLKEEIEHVLQVLNRELEHYQIKVDVDANHCRFFYSVKPMVHSILYNLVSNAMKYRAPDRRPTIRIASREEDNHYTLQVTDNGLGIDLQRNRENLFKLYKRFHHHTEGKGIGLYLVKLQAEALGGSIDVESEINRYTTFTVKLRKPENIDRQVLYQSPYVQIFYDAKVNCIGTTWQSPVTSHQYRSVFIKCLDFVKAYNTPNYIADITLQGHIAPQDQLWMFKNIMTEAAKNGLRYIGVVRPDAADDHIREYLANINVNLLRLGIRQEYFLSQDEAVAWIHTENEKAALAVRA
jgi:signal transduction histidine kinase